MPIENLHCIRDSVSRALPASHALAGCVNRFTVRADSVSTFDVPVTPLAVGRHGIRHDAESGCAAERWQLTAPGGSQLDRLAAFDGFAAGQRQIADRRKRDGPVAAPRSCAETRGWRWRPRWRGRASRRAGHKKSHRDTVALWRSEAAFRALAERLRRRPSRGRPLCPRSCAPRLLGHCSQRGCEGVNRRERRHRHCPSHCPCGSGSCSRNLQTRPEVLGLRVIAWCFSSGIDVTLCDSRSGF